jgi:hypothetical protein
VALSDKRRVFTWTTRRGEPRRAATISSIGHPAMLASGLAVSGAQLFVF